MTSVKTKRKTTHLLWKFHLFSLAMSAKYLTLTEWGSVRMFWRFEALAHENFIKATTNYLPKKHDEKEMVENDENNGNNRALFLENSLHTELN